MISRRKIISRSQSELDYSHSLYESEEDVWFSQDKLYQDHITEILRKWDQIDDEIWGKIICMERNRRIAKAYSRVPVLTISGSQDGFDGYKIGLNGFDNPMRDALTKTVKSHIGKGVRLKMDDMGNIIIKRMSNCDVFIRGWDRESNSLSNDIVELSGELEFERSLKLFDMKKFQSNVARELRSSYPDRKKLESQCICAIAFVKDTPEVLDLCSWVLLINIVALDLLKSRFPAILQNREPSSIMNNNVHYRSAPAPKFVSIFDDQEEEEEEDDSESTPRNVTSLMSRDQRRKIISDEDPYSVPLNPTNPSSNYHTREQMRSSIEHNIKSGKIPPSGRVLMPSNNNNNSQGINKKTVVNSSSNDPKPPELPPRDFAKIKGNKQASKPSRLGFPQAIRSLVSGKSNESKALAAQTKKQQQIAMEDPYYCGLEARVPNFGHRNKKVIPSKVVASSVMNNNYSDSSTGYGAIGQNSNSSSNYSYHLPRVPMPSNGIGNSNNRNHNNNQAPNHHYYHKAMSSSLQPDLRKSQSSGYLNSLFNQSSSSSERYASYWD